MARPTARAALVLTAEERSMLSQLAGSRTWLASHPGRFEYVHTPKHGSWLNLLESSFSKMVRSFLRHIRVASLDELKQRILKGIGEH